MNWLSPDEPALLTQVQKIVTDRRLKQGRSVRTSFVILNIKSIKYTVTTENRVMIAARKVLVSSGRYQ
ncbi:hypothetical protein EFP86_14240 [Lentilactobacillus hilgardii]|nr:hypothetical protein [Lentilactobacillus hilgardii]